MPTRALLVRHGQSEWNAAGRWQGQADPPLTDLGRRQARSAAKALGAVDAVFSSDLQRAAETATIIAEELGIGPVILDEGLRERDAGEWSGLTRTEIHRDWPGYLDPPADKHAGFGPSAASSLSPRRPPSWEPDQSVLTRALAALDRIHRTVGDGDVVAVTHGGLIYVLEGHLGDPAGRLANGGGRWFVIDDDGVGGAGARGVGGAGARGVGGAGARGVGGAGASNVLLGERVLLVGDDGAPVTVPDQI